MAFSKNASPDLLVSIILPCRNEGGNVLMTVNSMTTVHTQIPYEIIVVDDGSEDGCCDFLRQEESPFSLKLVKLVSTANQGAANARNVGAANARGHILVFCDAHITVEDNWLEGLLEALARPEVAAVTPAIGNMDQPDAFGYGQTWDDNFSVRWFPNPQKLYEVPLGPSGCLAVKLDVFHTVGGFERGFRVWGLEDMEFSLKLWLFGYRVYVTPSVKVLHLFRTAHPYSVSYDHFHYNVLRMAFSHFSPPRLTRVIDQIKSNSYFAKIMVELSLSDIWEQRARYFATRVYPDEWFFNTFLINV